MKEPVNIVRFSRPHTVIGTTVSISALYLIALSLGKPAQLHLGFWLLSLLACLGANIYIVGLNQITDIGIDRINKPWLPLASGDWSVRKAKTVIALGVALSLVLSFFLGPWLLLTVVLSLLLGTAYSLPPVRLKRFTFWAAFCIVAVRGLIVNVFIFLHFHFRFSGNLLIPPSVWLLTSIIFIYSIVIAWFKDIPDMEGDRRYRIRTLSIRLGAPAVFYTGNALLILCLLALIAFPAALAPSLDRLVLVAGHALILLSLIVAGYRVELDDRHSVFSYYRFVWVLFFAEYITFALAATAAS